jgi:tRNA pseudouridine38-40 synthase
VRFRLDIGYDGSGFSGWAEQPGRRTVAGEITAALGRVLRLPDAPRLVVAGRTDAGVHASGQVAHVDLTGDPDPVDLARRLAGVLPADIVVRSVTAVPDTFDARFSARARHYRYLITDGSPDPLERHRVLAWPRPLDVTLMAGAARSLVGEHDFAAYCKAREGATTRRRLLDLDVTRSGDLVTVVAAGQAFCHNQVRSMVGALLAVGDGRRPVDWPGEVLARGVRDSAVTVAPPYGLTLIAVDY